MNIRNGNITVREIVQTPAGRALVEREFPKIAKSPLFALAQGMTLNAVVGRWGNKISRQKAERLMAELKEL